MLKENNIWSGSNTFLKSVVFPKNQTFHLDNLVSDSPKSGSMLYYDGSKYSNIEPGSSNSSLVSSIPETISSAVVSPPLIII